MGPVGWWKETSGFPAFGAHDASTRLLAKVLITANILLGSYYLAEVHIDDRGLDKRLSFPILLYEVVKNTYET